MIPPPDPSAAQRKTLITVAVAVALLVCLLLGVGIGRGLFGLFGRPQAGLDQSAGAAPGLSRQAEPAPALNRQAEPAPSLDRQAKRMPQDIADWLRHLEETERRRSALSQRQIGKLMVQMTYLSLGAGKEVLQGLLQGDIEALGNQGPAQNLTTDAQAMRREWAELDAYFRSYPPPRECIPIMTSYTEVLNETGTMILAVIDSLANSQNDPSGAIAALNSMKGDSSSRIGRPAAETDRLVQAICDEYETRKWFSIASDFGQGSLGQIGGLPTTP
ncbi:MAG: hypothetical protein MH204_09050 [Fimbriimonadaceae bacterium]|nr:hypothetical protein [Fimbriimonadaceae bacterium]